MFRARGFAIALVGLVGFITSNDPTWLLAVALGVLLFWVGTQVQKRTR